MPLTAGMVAPEYAFTTLRGEALRLSELRGMPIWLSFSRFASCPLCNYEIHRITGEWSSRFSGVHFRHLRFFQSPAAKLHEYIATKAPPFDLVADPEMIAYRIYEVERSLRKMFTRASLRYGKAARKAGFPLRGEVNGPASRVPADFLIDAEGVIQLAFYGTHIADHVPLDVVTRFLNEEAEKSLRNP
ncbi:MAG TPA: redoxin domain-containing protein [Nannocystis exedens]|nr:redoxin domain-containing protein [Nannocystis exedens]